MLLFTYSWTPSISSAQILSSPTLNPHDCRSHLSSGIVPEWQHSCFETLYCTSVDHIIMSRAPVGIHSDSGSSPYLPTRLLSTRFLSFGYLQTAWANGKVNMGDVIRGRNSHVDVKNSIICCMGYHSLFF
jgi:hypothetical protein